MSELAKYRPRPKPEQDSALSKYGAILQELLARAQTAGQGGPQQAQTLQPTTAQKLALLRSSSPTGQTAPYVRNDLYGADPGAYAAPDAELLPNSQNPAVQLPPYLMRAEPDAVSQESPEYEAERLRSDLLWKSMNSPRGAAQHLENEKNNAALRQRIEYLKTAPVPAEYDENMRGPKRSAMQFLRYLTGQGGGMR